MKATGLNNPFPARPDDPDERPAITQNGGTRLRSGKDIDRLVGRRAGPFRDSACDQRIRASGSEILQEG